ncbi:hypothetical protein D3C77_519470 [compost metagenome]
MNQLTDFMGFEAAREAQFITSGHRYAVPVMIVQSLDFFCPDAERLAQRPWKTTKMAKVVLIDNTRPVRRNQSSAILNELLQLLACLFPAQIQHWSNDQLIPGKIIFRADNVCRYALFPDCPVMSDNRLLIMNTLIARPLGILHRPAIIPVE